jgi:hypothetical protein
MAGETVQPAPSDIKPGLWVKFMGDGLVAVVRLICLLAIKAEGLEDGRILHREENGPLAGIVCVFMPSPGREHKKVTCIPGEALTIDNAVPLPPEDVIDGAVRLPMSFGSHPRSDELDPTSHGGQHRPAGTISPGSRICTPAHSVEVAAHLPPRPGFMKAITRRSLPRSMGTKLAARWANGTMSVQR